MIEFFALDENQRYILKAQKKGIWSNRIFATKPRKREDVKPLLSSVGYFQVYKTSSYRSAEGRLSPSRCKHC